MNTFKEENIRIETATEKNAKIAAQLIFDTDPHLWAYLFMNDETALQYFETEWKQTHSAFSFVHCTAAVNGGSLLGIEIGYDLKIRTENRSNSKNMGVRDFTPEQLEHIFEAREYLSFLLPPIPDDAYYIACLASLPDVRNKGIGGRLLANAFNAAISQGYRALHLDVASDNPAVRFYERMGMEIVSESRVLPLEAHGVSSHYRMVRRFDA